MDLNELLTSSDEIKQLNNIDTSKEQKNALIGVYSMSYKVNNPLISDFLNYQTCITLKNQTQFLNELVKSYIKQLLNTESDNNDVLIDLWINYKNNNIDARLIRAMDEQRQIHKTKNKKSK